MSPSLNAPAPSFSLPDQNGTLHALDQYKGKWVVLYFYPKDDTPGCTVESCGFRDKYADFSSANAVVLGISCDNEESHAAFAKKFSLPFPLLADTEHTMVRDYGVWVEKNVYGKQSMGIARTTFVIDPAGRIAHIFESVKPEHHEKAVLATLGK